MLRFQSSLVNVLMCMSLLLVPTPPHFLVQPRPGSRNTEISGGELFSWRFQPKQNQDVLEISGESLFLRGFQPGFPLRGIRRSRRVLGHSSVPLRAMGASCAWPGEPGMQQDHRGSAGRAGSRILAFMQEDQTLYCSRAQLHPAPGWVGVRPGALPLD